MYLTVRGVKLYYEVSGGNGTPLLLLHGWGGNTQSFLPVIRDMSDHHIVYAIDFPGHGRSDPPDRPWSVTEYMECICSFLKDQLIVRPDIVAHSFGGRVAILLSATYPDMVGRLVLTGAAGIPPKPAGKKTLKSRVYRLLKGIVKSDMLKSLLGEKKTEDLQERLVQQFGSPDYRALSPFMRQTFNRVISQDLTPYLPKIQSPVLLIWGADDTETPLWMGEIMRDQIRDAGLVVWQGCGHFAYLDRYGDFISVLRSFIG